MTWPLIISLLLSFLSIAVAVTTMWKTHNHMKQAAPHPEKPPIGGWSKPQAKACGKCFSQNILYHYRYDKGVAEKPDFKICLDCGDRCGL